MLTGFQLPAWLVVLSASGWMTAIDLLIDPLAAGALHYWRWLEPGAYYGIPLENFLGWFAVSWLIFALLKLVSADVERPAPGAAAIGLSMLLFFTCIALAQQQKLLAGIGGGLCLAHWLIAHKQNRMGSLSLRNPRKQRLPTFNA
jgi:putative membrane protein